MATSDGVAEQPWADVVPAFDRQSFDDRCKEHCWIVLEYCKRNMTRQDRLRDP